MRIISKKKDYYDCVQRTGQDQTLIYVRKPEEVQLKRGEWKFPCVGRFGRIPNWSKTCIIGFCGNIYPMIELTSSSNPDDVANCFSVQEVDKFLQRTLKKKSWEEYSQAKYRWYGGSRPSVVAFFEKCQKAKSSFKKMFDDKQCPVFVATKSDRVLSVVYNALLKPYEFFRVMDTHTAFQEIAMFMNNFAVPQKPMPIISNELKIHSRGFDKWSFRKEPTKKRKL